MGWKRGTWNETTNLKVFQDPKMHSIWSRESRMLGVLPVTAPKRAVFTKYSKKLYPQKGPMIVKCNPEIWAAGLLPRTGSKHTVEDLWTEEEVLFTSQEVAGPEGRWLAHWRFESVQRANCYCTLHLNSRLWWLHIKIILSWDPEFPCGARSSVHRTTGYFKQRAT